MGSKKICINGVLYDSIKSCCDTLGLNMSSVYSFMNYGSINNIEDAIIGYMNSNHKVQGNKARKAVVVNGKTYNTMVACCRSLGLSFSKVRDYARNHDVDFVTALSEYKECYTSGICYDGVFYKSKSDCCRSLGLSFSKVRDYARHNDVDFTTALTKYKDLDSEMVSYRGVSYLCKTDCCKKYDLSPNAVFLLMRKYVCSFEDAMDYSVLKKHFHIKEFVEFMQSNVMVCKCRITGVSYLFSRELAFRYIGEIYGK